MLKSRDLFERTSFKMNIHAFVLLVFICTRYGCDSRKRDKKSSDLCKNVLVNVEENSKSITKLEATVVEQLKDLRSELPNAIRMIMDKGNVNLALRRPATQSSTYRTRSNADTATDGNRGGDSISSSCTLTNKQANPWWKVDLGYQVSINKVVIYNRHDCCGERWHDMILTVSNTTNGEEVICGQYKGPSTNDAIETIWCAPDTVGRFLKIKIDGTEWLNLCEVEVY